ncbi:LOW QUALITY PROTEIN: hypothetical protein CVT25_015810, partial [Psilocybe cyanescens]
FALIIALGQAPIYVLTGLYSQPADLGAGVCLLLIIQLIFAELIVILPDELLQKGYGHGSGINLFIKTNIYESIAFPPTTVNIGGGSEFEGAIALQSTLTSNVFVVSQILATRFARTLLVKILGVWEDIRIFANTFSQFSCYLFLCLPSDLQSHEDSPRDRVLHVATAYTQRSRADPDPHGDLHRLHAQCIEISGSGPRDVAKQLKDQQMESFSCRSFVLGFRSPFPCSQGHLPIYPLHLFRFLLRIFPLFVFNYYLICRLTASPTNQVMVGHRAAFGGAILGLPPVSADLSDWEIGMHKSGGLEMAASGDLLHT